MPKCKAKTRDGNPCRNNALQGSMYCGIPAHSDSGAGAGSGGAARPRHDNYTKVLGEWMQTGQGSYHHRDSLGGIWRQCLNATEINDVCRRIFSVSSTESRRDYCPACNNALGINSKCQQCKQWYSQPGAEGYQRWINVCGQCRTFSLSQHQAIVQEGGLRQDTPSIELVSEEMEEMEDLAQNITCKLCKQQSPYNLDQCKECQQENWQTEEELQRLLEITDGRLAEFKDDFPTWAPVNSDSFK